MAKTPAQRKAEQRERDKMREEERQARLLARRLSIDLFHATDAALVRGMARAEIDEPQDFISRLLHGQNRLSDEGLAELIRLP